MEEELLSLDCFVSSSSPDKYHILYKFNYPKHFKEDILKIINGKYSTITNEAKFCILQFVKGDKNTQMGQILYLGPVRRKQLEEEIGEKLPANAELLSIFDPTKEVFLNKFKIDYEPICRTTTETC